MKQMKKFVLIGFMGTGKTSAGRLLAERLGYSFVDIDRKIEADCKMKIQDMFAAKGEKYFRDQETKVTHQVAARQYVVISTGGGTVLDPRNRAVLRKDSIIIALEASVDVILERTGRRDQRPVLAQGDRHDAVVKLQAARDHLYKQADYIVDTTDLTLPQVVDQIMGYIKKDVEARA